MKIMLIPISEQKRKPKGKRKTKIPETKLSNILEEFYDSQENSSVNDIQENVGTLAHQN